jgi:hypothetical protein
LPCSNHSCVYWCAQAATSPGRRTRSQPGPSWESPSRPEATIRANKRASHYHNRPSEDLPACRPVALRSAPGQRSQHARQSRRRCVGQASSTALPLGGGAESDEDRLSGWARLTPCFVGRMEESWSQLSPLSTGSSAGKRQSSSDYGKRRRFQATMSEAIGGALAAICDRLAQRHHRIREEHFARRVPMQSRASARRYASPGFGDEGVAPDERIVAIGIVGLGSVRVDRC